MFRIPAIAAVVAVSLATSAPAFAHDHDHRDSFGDHIAEAAVAGMVERPVVVQQAPTVVYQQPVYCPAGTAWNGAACVAAYAPPPVVYQAPPPVVYQAPAPVVVQQPAQVYYR